MKSKANQQLFKHEIHFHICFCGRRPCGARESSTVPMFQNLIDFQNQSSSSRQHKVSKINIVAVVAVAVVAVVATEVVTAEAVADVVVVAAAALILEVVALRVPIVWYASTHPMCHFVQFHRMPSSSSKNYHTNNASYCVSLATLHIFGQNWSRI